MSTGPEPVVLPAQAREAMERHARNCLPQEACGLLATGDGAIRMVYPLTNAAASPARFTIDPREHFGALQHAERSGWEIGGVFHSHPQGQAVLSPTDLDQPHDPGWLHIVIGFVPSLHLRAWRIEAGQARQVPYFSGR